jgi:hypothetical protein
MLEELGAAFADEVVAVGQFLSDRAAQVVACRLKDFHSVWLSGGYSLVAHYLYQIAKHYPD